MRYSGYFGLLCATLLGMASPAIGQEYYGGARIREPASPSVKTPATPETQTCETCGGPTRWSFKQCFHCLQKQAPHDFKQWFDKTWDASRESLERLRDPRLTDKIIEKLLETKKHYQNSRRNDRKHDREQQRQLIENLGKCRTASGSFELNDFARETVKKYIPALEGTDYGEDPVKTLSYFLILDGKGFLENIRCVRGPFGEPMTVMEAYQYYTRTDPQKAQDLLELIDNVHKLSSPDSGEESIPVLLDTLARTLRILKNENSR